MRERADVLGIPLQQGEPLPARLARPARRPGWRASSSPSTTGELVGGLFLFRHGGHPRHRLLRGPGRDAREPAGHDAPGALDGHPRRASVTAPRAIELGRRGPARAPCGRPRPASRPTGLYEHKRGFGAVGWSARRRDASCSARGRTAWPWAGGRSSTAVRARAAPGERAPTARCGSERAARRSRAWDAFVEASETAFPLQLSAWAEAKAATGWRARAGRRRRRLGADRRPAARPSARARAVRPGLPAPRPGGATPSTRAASTAFTAALREVARAQRLTHVTADPGLEGTGASPAAAAAGWRPARAAPAHDARQLIDLSHDRGRALVGRLQVQPALRQRRAQGRAAPCARATRATLPVVLRHPRRDRPAQRLHPPRPGGLSGRLPRLRAASAARACSSAPCRTGAPVSSKLILVSGGRAAQLYGGLTDAGWRGARRPLLRVGGHHPQQGGRAPRLRHVGPLDRWHRAFQAGLRRPRRSSTAAPSTSSSTRAVHAAVPSRTRAPSCGWPAGGAGLRSGPDRGRRGHATDRDVSEPASPASGGSWRRAACCAARCRCRRTAADRRPLVGAIRYDSRQVRPGDVFVARRGQHADGHDHVLAAVAAGAVRRHRRAARSRASACPSSWCATAPGRSRPRRRPGVPATHRRHLGVVGITGTDGKTTTAYLVRAVLEAAGRRAGLAGHDRRHRRRPQPRQRRAHQHPRGPRAAGPPRRHARRRRHVGGPRVDLARPGAAARRRRRLRRRRAHQHHLGAPRVPRHAGGLSRGQAAPLRAPRRQRRRTPRRAGASTPSSMPTTPRARSRPPSPSCGRARRCCATAWPTRPRAIGRRTPPDVSASDIAEARPGLRFTLRTADWSGPIELRLAGRFNVHNALAALGVAHGARPRPGASAARPRPARGRPRADAAHRRGPALQRHRRLRAHRRGARQGARRAAAGRPGRRADRRLRLRGRA